MPRKPITQNDIILRLSILDIDYFNIKPEDVSKMRKEDLNIYNYLKKADPDRVPRVKINRLSQITDEEILEEFKKYGSDLVSFRENDMRLYREGLKRDILPFVKGTRPRRRKTPPKKEKVDENLYGKGPYLTRYLDNNDVICGRCLETRTPTREHPGICKTCKNQIANLKAKGLDSNKWNIKDKFINTIIRERDKVFNIGIRVDKRTEEYLTALGYGFIFKKEYDL